MTVPTVWRLHIKQEPHVKVPDRCRFCVEDDISGVGWGVPPHEAMQWSDYCERAVPRYGRVNGNVRRLQEDVKCGDLIWSRDTKGKYYLGRILDGWEYRHSNGHEAADIHNVRPCNWQLVGDMTEVPGTVRNAFIRGQTLRAIRDETVIWFSMDLFNRLTGCSHYQPPKIERNLLSLLDPDACEDLVGIYLQSRGWILFPSTCKTETQNYEFILRHRVTRRMAAVQVKQGRQELVISEYEEFDGDIFLFQTEDRYKGTATKHTTTLLTSDEMKSFCIKNVDTMPTPIQRWVQLVMGL